MKARFGPVEPLRADHRVEGFDCGSTAQSHWLTRHALQAHRSGLSRVYVVTPATKAGADRRDGSEGANGNTVVGYYALAAGSVSPAQVPSRLTRGAGRYHQPVVILTRLGVSVDVQGGGLGRALVVNALRRVAEAGEVIGVRALLIHCEGESARQFYLRLARFESSPSDPLHLHLPMKDLRRALS